MKKVLAISFLVLIAVVSCKKKDSAQPSPGSGTTTSGTQKCTVTKSTSDSNITEYTYNSDGLLTQEKYYTGQHQTGWTDYAYNSGKLASASDYDEFGTAINLTTFDWYYSGQLLQQTKYGYYSSGKKIDEIFDYTYTNGNLTKSEEKLYSSDGSLFGSQYSIYEYDNAGNPTKETFYNGSNNQVVYSSTMTYDSKPYMFQNLDIAAGHVWTKANNVLTNTYKNANGDLMETVSNAIEYNAEGYPSKITTTSQTGNDPKKISVAEYQYTCK